MRVLYPVLAATMLLILSATGAEAQDWTLDPTYNTVNLNEGFLPDPYTRTLTAGGSRQPKVSGCAFGKVANAPDIDLNYSSSGSASLYFYVESDEDTTLLINTPSGEWICDDDDHTGLNPLVIVRGAQGGLYNIWVGTYGEDLATATLNISEIDPR